VTFWTSCLRRKRTGDRFPSTATRATGTRSRGVPYELRSSIMSFGTAEAFLGQRGARPPLSQSSAPVDTRDLCGMGQKADQNTLLPSGPAAPWSATTSGISVITLEPSPSRIGQAYRGATSAAFIGA
jgi:hypothetical protein